MSKVSVIIPVYNMEAYLDKCLDAVINQTYPDIEIIILNDGSQDSSHDLIVNKYVADNRVKYLTHPNRGLGPTRNRGIELAKGDYLCFIDSDDFIERDYIECLVETAIKHQADIVCCEHYKWYREHDFTVSVDFKHDQHISIHEIEANRFISQFIVKRIFSMTAWAKLYKSDLIKKQHIQFGDNHRVFAEDRYFNMCILGYADRISFVHRPMYYYRKRMGSIMDSYKTNLLDRHMNMIEDVRKFAEPATQQKMMYMIASMFFIEAIIKNFQNDITYQKGIVGQFAALRKLNQRDDIHTYIQEFIDQKLYRLLNKNEKRKSRQLAYLLKYRLYLLVPLHLDLDQKIGQIRNYFESRNNSLKRTLKRWIK